MAVRYKSNTEYCCDENDLALFKEYLYNNKRRFTITDTIEDESGGFKVIYMEKYNDYE